MHHYRILHEVTRKMQAFGRPALVTGADADADVGLADADVTFAAVDIELDSLSVERQSCLINYILFIVLHCMRT